MCFFWIKWMFGKQCLQCLVSHSSLLNTLHWHLLSGRSAKVESGDCWIMMSSIACNGNTFFMQLDEKKDHKCNLKVTTWDQGTTWDDVQNQQFRTKIEMHGLSNTSQISNHSNEGWMMASVCVQCEAAMILVHILGWAVWFCVDDFVSWLLQNQCQCWWHKSKVWKQLMCSMDNLIVRNWWLKVEIFHFFRFSFCSCSGHWLFASQFILFVFCMNDFGFQNFLSQ